MKRALVEGGTDRISQARRLRSTAAADDDCVLFGPIAAFAVASMASSRARSSAARLLSGIASLIKQPPAKGRRGPAAKEVLLVLMLLLLLYCATAAALLLARRRELLGLTVSSRRRRAGEGRHGTEASPLPLPFITAAAVGTLGGGGEK